MIPYYAVIVKSFVKYNIPLKHDNDFQLVFIKKIILFVSFENLMI